MGENSEKENVQADDDGVAQLVEITDFFKFSVLPDATYRGTVLFRLSSEGRERYDVAVRICDDGTVKVWEQGPPDGVVNVTLDMPKADFLKVYSGTASAKAVTGMVLSGRLYVHGWKFGALKHFANSFDYSSECWERFYAARDAEAAAKEQAEAEAKAKAEAEAEAEAEAAAAAAAEKAAALAATHGHTSISMPLAAAKQQRIQRQIAEGKLRLADALGDTARRQLERALAMPSSDFVPHVPGLLPASPTSAMSRRGRRSDDVGAQEADTDAPEGAWTTLDDDDAPELGPALSVYFGVGGRKRSRKRQRPRSDAECSPDGAGNQNGAGTTSIDSSTTTRAAVDAAAPAAVPHAALSLTAALCDRMLSLSRSCADDGTLFIDALARAGRVHPLYGGLVLASRRRVASAAAAASPPVLLLTCVPGRGDAASRLHISVNPADYWHRFLEQSSAVLHSTPATSSSAAASDAVTTIDTVPAAVFDAPPVASAPSVASATPATSVNAAGAGVSPLHRVAPPFAVTEAFASEWDLPNPWWCHRFANSVSPVLPVPFSGGPAPYPTLRAAHASSRADVPPFAFHPCGDAAWHLRDSIDGGVASSAGGDGAAAAPSLQLLHTQWDAWVLPPKPREAVAAAMAVVAAGVARMLSTTQADVVGRDGPGASATAAKATPFSSYSPSMTVPVDATTMAGPDELGGGPPLHHTPFPATAAAAMFPDNCAGVPWPALPGLALGNTGTAALTAAAVDASVRAAAERAKARRSQPPWRRLKEYVAQVRRKAAGKAPPHRSRFGTVVVGAGDVDHDWGKGIRRLTKKPHGEDKDS